MTRPDLDLNLLVVFNAIMETGNLTEAARRLGQAQPTVSHALNRLRRSLDDPLFVRSGHGVEPTPYAVQLAGPVAHALKMVQSGLARPATFDPLTSRINFTLLMSDLGQAILLPALVTWLRSEAPEITITADQRPRSDYADALKSGRADLAIGSLKDLQAGFYQQRLFTDDYVCVVSANHPTLGDTITLEEYLDAKHVGVISPGLSEVEIDKQLLPAGCHRKIAVRVTHYLAAPALIPDTNLVLTVPSRVMSRVPDQSKVRIARLALDTPPTISVHQYWHERSHHDDANRWLRRLMASLLADHHSPSDESRT